MTSLQQTTLFKKLHHCGRQGKLEHHLLKCKEETSSNQNKNKCQAEDSGLTSHHDPSIAKEFVSSRKNLPFPLESYFPFLMGRLHGRRGAMSADLTVLAVFHGSSSATSRSHQGRIWRGTTPPKQVSSKIMFFRSPDFIKTSLTGHYTIPNELSRT